MTSLLTNVAAMTALQTLQSTNNAMEATQNRISTGLRVAEARDNAAYWSIATTMRSDNTATAATMDALGLGSATVDTAYTGMTAIKDVLNEIKAKLTASTQDGVDRSKVQSEITELQKQMKSIADSATFSGANWLSVDSGKASYSSETSIVSSFARTASGAISLGSITLNVDELKLYDANGAIDPTNAGMLDKGIDLLDANGEALEFGGSSSSAAIGTGGIKTADVSAGKSIARAAADFAAPLTFDEIGDRISFDVNIASTDADGNVTTKTTAVTIARGTVQTALDNSADSVSITTAADYVKVVQQALKDQGVAGVNVGTAPGTGAGGTILTFTSDAGTVSISGAGGTNGTAGSGTDLTAATLALDTNTTTYQPAVATMDAFKAPMQLTGDANIKFSIAMDGADPATEITIDKATISDALGTTDGKINSAYEFQRVVLAALDTAGLDVTTAAADVTVGSLANGAVTFTSRDESNASRVVISNVTTKKDGTDGVASTSAQISIADIDVTTAALEARGATTKADIQKVLNAYINVVDHAIEEVTTAASNLGSITNRIDMQQTFLSKLTDTIDKGIGTLVDADMTEESTRLKALQTQQQLGVQSLSIANQSSQALLQLFQ